ncbi:MAG TPA: DNA methyltransferase [Gemmataceae bacterium]|nr:DNA methyltransferase [Gemmataceae bacterium]
MPPTALEPLHRFHSYCARFPSEIVETALEKYTKPGDSVFDPFCGSGTTLVACLAHRRKAIGTDIDILAGMLTELKSKPYTRDRYDVWRERFASQLSEHFADITQSWMKNALPPLGKNWLLGSLQLPIPGFPELRYWFPPQLTAALAAIAQAAHECEERHFEQVALVSLSASIIAKWPNTLSYAMDIDHTRPHRRVQRFTLDRVLTAYLARLDRSITCLSELHRIYTEANGVQTFAEAARVVYPHDARTAAPHLENESQTLVVTSPPYFNAVDYPRAHRLSVCWMNGYSPDNLVSRRQYIGLRHAGVFNGETWLKERPMVRQLIPTSIHRKEAVVRRLCAFYADLEAVLRHCWNALRAGGHALFVIANNVIQGKRIESHRILAELAKRLGFQEKRIDTREIAPIRRRFPVGPFGFDGPMTHEYLIVLRKPRHTSR